MSDHPIIFSAPMVRALLDGRKTQTRRLAWRHQAHRVGQSPVASPWQRVRQGDRLWVRERCLTITGGAYRGVRYFADGTDTGDWNRADEGGQWDTKSRPSIHMPRWASRLTLHVEAVRVERLQDISEEDAMAEGVTPATEPPTAAALMTAVGRGAVFMPHRSAFANIWNSLHGPTAWDANPEVVVLQIRVERRNIDA